MNHGFANFLGATAAWLCLAPVACAREHLSASRMLPSGFNLAHYFASSSFLVIWILGGTFLALGGFRVFVGSRFRAHKSEPAPQPSRVYAISQVDVEWTLVPLFVLVLFLL
jgi:hypothetical protein